MREKPNTIEGYLAAIGRDRRAPLERLRQAIRRAVPAAEECISYGMPAFRVAGGIVAGFAVTKDGYSYYPFSGQTLSELSSELDGYERTKSAVHFSAKRPLSPGLLRKLLQARSSEIQGTRAGAKPGEATTGKPRDKPAVTHQNVAGTGRGRAAGVKAAPRRDGGPGPAVRARF